MGQGKCDASIRDKQGLTALHISVSCNTGDVNSSTEYQQALTEKYALDDVGNDYSSGVANGDGGGCCC